MNIRERNHRAREYSRYCFRVRLVKRMWLVAAVLWALFLAALCWVLTLPMPEEAPPPSPAVVNTVAEQVGSKTYIAADTGVYGYTVDILMDHEAAAVAGVRRELVTWETA